MVLTLFTLLLLASSRVALALLANRSTSHLFTMSFHFLAVDTEQGACGKKNLVLRQVHSTVVRLSVDGP